MTMERKPFDDYWAHKRIRATAPPPRKPVLRWWDSTGSDRMNDVERMFLTKFGSCRRILDFGAGDNRIKTKFLQQGYRGEFRTFDVSLEFPHDYRSVEEIGGRFDCIFLLEVIEHLPLPAFYETIDLLVPLLAAEGTLVVSTPNPACIYPMWAGDMTHIQQYPLSDLLAIFMRRGFACESYRVVMTKERVPLTGRFRLFLKKVVTTRILGVDYAEGIIVIARRGHG